MVRLEYCATRRKRGRAAMWAAVACGLLFGFFLIAGFSGASWMGVALTLVAAASLSLFLYGASLARSGSGGVVLTREGICAYRGRRRVFLAYEQIDRARFGGVFQPCLRLRAGAARAVVYKALPGYPLVWNRLSAHGVAPKAPEAPLRVSCLHAQHMGALLAGALISLVALAVVAAFLPRVGLAAWTAILPCALLAAVALFCLWSLLRDMRTVAMGAEGVRVRGWFREGFTPASQLKEVVLDQAAVRALVTGYRYRGEAMTADVRYTSVALGLCVRVGTSSDALEFDETMTGYPMELLFEAFRAIYCLPARLVLPELELTP